MTVGDLNITAIGKAVDLIEANLKEAITIADMADAACYSLYHFCRMFNAITQHTPYDYLMRRRLSEAARELVETDRKIIEIAFDYQFNSHEVFIRAFKRMFETPPTQWRKQGQLLTRHFMPKLTRQYLTHIQQGVYLRPVFEEKVAFSVAGFMTLAQDNSQIIADLWKLLMQTLQDLDQNPGSLQYYGITWYPQANDPRHFCYMAAREISSLDTVSPVFVLKTIPASHYVRFTHKGRVQDLPLTLAYIYHTWLPKSGQRLAYPQEIVCYGPQGRGAEQEEVEIRVYLPLRQAEQS